MSSAGADAAIVEGAQHTGGNPEAPLHGSPEISKSIRLPFLASSSHFQNFHYFFLILCCYSFPGDSGVDMFGCDGLMVASGDLRVDLRVSCAWAWSLWW